ncbi:hypothetical protein NLJ89_g10399 [Agrocybe chaxingu]|uniref:Uncharacterized protein n=1 Tax=Agrocybe chaxingu TaxID=84603 RepID=A0A9W8JRC8_9AGAR|nr:hypothetical protein NLJ89_g10399 [Agrocybe chaxingu]
MSRNTSMTKNPTNQGPNLRTDLEKAFATKTLSFQGTFAHSSVKTDAPNPVLTIEGLGTIGLPLNERDATAIIASMTPKPSGKGKKGKAAKDTREAWEVEGAKVAFGNGEWTQWVDGTICREVWTALGVQQHHNSMTKLVLRCVVLSKGPHTLSTESSQRPEGTFATAVIFLPSQHTGGQVNLSHSSVTKSFDDAPKSITSTTLLTWYNAVQQQVQPIESGYRLALVYNVVQPPVAGVPLPSLPDMSGPVIALRNALKGWEDGRYESSEPKQGFLAYLLQHNYSPLLMPSGSAPLMQLKGPDKYRVEALQQAASELEFLVGFAQVEYYICGMPFRASYGRSRYGSKRRRYGGYGGGGWGRRRSGYDILGFELGLGLDDEDDEDNDGTAIDEVYESSTTLSHFRDLKGGFLLPIDKLDVDHSSFIPENPFNALEPDEKDHGCAGMIEHRYRRTVLLLIPEEEEQEICYAAGGLKYAFAEIQSSTDIPPTDDDRLWASRVLEKSSNGTSLEKDQSTFMLDLAVKWKDIAMWKACAKGQHCTLHVLGKERLHNALKEFGFSKVSVSFQEILDRSRTPRDGINFLVQLPALSSRADQPATVAWCKTQTDKLCSSYNNVQVKEIPVLLDMVKVVGFTVFAQLMMPNLLKAHANYDFCIALAKALTESAASIAEHEAARATPVSADAVGLEVKKSVKEFLQRAAAQWPAPEPSVYGLPSYTQEPKASLPLKPESLARISEVIEQCIITGHVNVGVSLLNQLLAMKGSFAKKLNHLHLKLIPHLTGVVQALRVHIEGRCDLAMDLCTYETIRSGSPYAVKITKRPEIVRAGKWESRQQEAKAVLSKIGTDEEIQVIMEPRWKDVQDAIAGITPFIPTPRAPVAASAPSAPQNPAAGDSTSVSRGVKRKL